ncbi:hypothetical protein BDV96DRAFT_604360 [Lophiotrema nucula]|uniref:rRNA-processing protein FYV7 n=1 Tax=Lophiotrema nucula TaxID=690887 RepID=A0A6A5YUP1_9PLEO|nr:hypothetical protein BDV96DRAFT_604360 [Lophiotrema nucula]
MAPKRSREDDSSRPAKKQKKGFSVGPANLPDGTYKRKVQKIKKDLIHKAKLKKEYAKVKAREDPTTQKSVYDRDDDEGSVEAAAQEAEPTLEPHPDRLRLLEEGPIPPDNSEAQQPWQRKKRPRPQTYKNETEFARKRKQEADARQKAHEEAERERQTRIAERARFKKQMAKARGGPAGKPKLGRESTVLLEKIKRMTGQAR